MVTQPSPSGTTSHRPKQSMRAESRLKISEGLRRSLTSQKLRVSKMRTTSPAVASPAVVENPLPSASPHISVLCNDDSPQMLNEAGMEQESPPLSLGTDLREATSLMVAQGASLFVSPRLLAKSDLGDQGACDEFEMEQASPPSHADSKSLQQTLSYIVSPQFQDDGLQQIYQRLSGIEQGFKTEILALTEEFSISRAENTRLKAVETEAYNAVKAFEREKHELYDQLRTAQADNSKLKDQLRDAQAGKSKLQSSVELAAIHLSVLERGQEKLVDQLSQCEFENERLRSTNEDINKDMDSLKEECRQLQDLRYIDLPNLKTNLDEIKLEKDQLAKIVSELSEVVRCGICCDILKKPVVLSCHHVFCFRELHEWREHRKVDALGHRLTSSEFSCPTCRQRVTVGYQLSSLYGIKNLLKALKHHSSG